jgi:hypothetical protein
VAARPEQPKLEPKPKARPKGEAPDLGALRKPVLDANAGLTKAETEAKALVDRALVLVAQAKGEYREALGLYREACRKAGVDCEFPGGRSENVSPKVSFIVEKADKGIRVMVKGKPDSEEIIPLAALKASIGKAAYAYTDKHVGPRERVGNKGGYVVRCSYVECFSLMRKRWRIAELRRGSAVSIEESVGPAYNMYTMTRSCVDNPASLLAEISSSRALPKVGLSVRRWIDSLQD